jgi:hypothetical protein
MLAYNHLNFELSKFIFKFILKNNSRSKVRVITIKHNLSACHTMVQKLFQIPHQVKQRKDVHR